MFDFTLFDLQPSMAEANGRYDSEAVVTYDDLIEDELQAIFDSLASDPQQS